jgi:hypothetical protein
LAKVTGFDWTRFYASNHTGWNGLNAVKTSESREVQGRLGQRTSMLHERMDFSCRQLEASRGF